MIKNVPAMQETRVRSLGQEDPLEKGRQPTPVFLPEEKHGQRSLAGYGPWGCKESDTTEQLTLSLQSHQSSVRPQGKFPSQSCDLSPPLHHHPTPCLNLAKAS